MLMWFLKSEDKTVAMNWGDFGQIFKTFFIFPIFFTTNPSFLLCVKIMASASNLFSNSCCCTPTRVYMSEAAQGRVTADTPFFKDTWNDSCMKIYMYNVKLVNSLPQTFQRVPSYGSLWDGKNSSDSSVWCQ